MSRDGLFERRLEQARQFALPEGSPLGRQAIALLERGVGFEEVSANALGERRVRHPELPRYELLCPPLAHEVIHLLPLLIAHHQLREFLEGEGIGLLYLPRVDLLLWGERAAALVEFTEPLTEEESRQLYRTLSRDDLCELLRVWAHFRTLHLSPKEAPMTAEGRILIGLEQLRCRRLGELSLSLLPAVREEDREWLIDEWGRQLRALERETRYRPFSVDPYLLPEDHPVQRGLSEICRSPNDFIDRGTMMRAGFLFEELVGECHLERIFVAGHPSIPGYLIKSYPLLGDPLDHYRHRLRNYLKRLKGAEAIRCYIERAGARHLIVPGKWLHRMPPQFATPSTPEGKYVLVVERMELLSHEESALRWWEISRELLEEFFRMAVATGFNDMTLHNLPWTRDGKIALIDTESFCTTIDHVGREVVHAVRPDFRVEAAALWKELAANRS